MRVLTLISLLIACAAGSSLVGSKACTWGPSYWCRDVKHARECGATKHCLQTVWKYQKLQQKTSVESCTYCQLIVNGLKDALHNKQAQVDIGKVLSAMCSLLPNPDWKDQCSGIVTEYTPEIIQMLDNDISAVTMCAAISLCPGLEDAVSPYGNQDSLVGTVNNECDDCQKFMGDIQKSITSNETVDQLEQLINQALCSSLGTFSSACNELVQQFLPDALQFLAEQFDPNMVCLVFGFCANTGKNVPKIPLSSDMFKQISQRPLQYRSSEECDICKETVNQLDELLRDKINQDKVKDFVKNDVCVELGSFAARCQQIVDEYAPMGFEYLLNLLDPTTLCQTVGLCVTPSLESSVLKTGSHPDVIQAVRLVPAHKMTLDVDQSHLKNGVECEICKVVMGAVDALLESNETVTVLEDLIFKVCDRLSGELKNQCHAFVEEYGQMVLDLLAKDLKPEEICAELTLCTASHNTVHVGDEVCDLCQLAIKELEAALKNVSVDEIIGYAKQVCSFMPGNLSVTCTDYVTKYGPIVINLLKSGEDPKSLCEIGQLCSAASAHHLVMTVPIPEQLPVKTKPSITCEVCDTAIVLLKNMLGNNATEAEIKHEMESLCSYLPSSLVTECQSLIDQYGDRIVQGIIANLDANVICQGLGLCQASSVKMPAIPEFLSPYDTLPIQEEGVKPAEATPSVSCQVCGTAIVILKNLLGNNATEAEIKHEMESLCSYLPASLVTECQSLINQYGDQIVQGIIANLDANAICQSLGLCQASSVKMPAIPDFLSPYNTLPIQEEGVKPVTQKSIECDTCKTAVSEIIRFIGQNKTQMEIEAGLDKVCDMLQSSLSVYCQDLVTQYSQQLINLLLLNVDPSVICQKIDLCPVAMEKSLPHPVHVTLLKDDQALKSRLGASPSCALCEFAVKTLLDKIGDNKTEANIEAELGKLCDVLPTTISTECKDFVEQYGPMIIKLVLSDVKPNEICTAIDLCSAANLAKSGALVHLLKGKPLEATGPSCVLCEFVMKELDNLIKDNKSEAAIVAAVEKVCTLLPTTISKECDDFVKQYGPALIELLETELDPEAICSKLGLCMAKMLPKLAGKLHLPKVGPECAFCQMAVMGIKALAGENKTTAQIEQFLDELCSFLPDTVTFQCDEAIKEKIPQILEWLKQSLNPEQVCQELQLCTTSKKQDAEDTKLYFRPQKQMLGTKECTYGPAYWCASQENAQKCNAVSHCKNHVWKN